VARVLLVSKPIVPPWNDSSKNLARDVADGLARHVPIALGDGSAGWRPARGSLEPVYRDAGRFAPGIDAQLRLLRRLLLGARADVWHFFFAPNAKSSTASRACAVLRRVATLQTVCSRPRDVSRAKRLLFADRTVVLSRATHTSWIDAGVDPARLAHIPPAVPELAVPSDDARSEARARFSLPADRPLVVFPGDLELGDGASRAIEAAARSPRVHLAMACRAKTPRAADAERSLRERARPFADRVSWIGETAGIHELLGAADVVLLPSTDLYAKMDLPLVLLEAMWLARAVIVAKDSPAAELADGAIAVDPSPEAIAAELDALAGDTDRRAALGARARRIARERYEPARMASAYEELYDSVLAEHSA
jgi:glycosyltransferase involved in cell wall biosynthesis